MIDENLHELAAAYALGSLEPVQRRSFEAELAARPELRALVREYEEVSGLLACGAGDAQPRAELKARVLQSARDARIDVKVIPIARRRMALPAGLAWAAAIVGLLLAGAQTVRIVRLRSDYVAAANRRDELQRRQDAILDGKTKMYALRPTSGDSSAYGAQLFWRRDQNTWLVHAFKLPKLPGGKVYQLWYVTATAKISAGVFEVDEEGHGVAVLDVPVEARGATVAAMSVEPGPRGSTQPTGPIVIAGGVASE